MATAEVLGFFATLAGDPAMRTLTHEQMRFLTALASFSSPPSMSSVGAAANMRSTQSTRIASSLARHGLVERLPATDGDLRITRVRLTEEGKAVYEKLARAYRNR